MARPVVMPKLGQSEEEGKLVRWLKKEGDAVARGDILFEIETDKALLEVESFFDGTLLKVLVPEGETVPVQSVVGFIGEPGEAIPAVPAPKPEPTRTPAASPAATRSIPAREVRGRRPEATERMPDVGPVAVPARETAAPEVFRISPRAARLARECAIDPSPIGGTGPGGRIVERDVRAYLDAKGYNQLRLTPAAKKRAVEEKLDVLTLRARGDSGRITLADVEAALAERPKPLSRMRQIIAERLTRSFTTAPHFFVTTSVDMTDLVAFRAELKAQGAPYTLTDFILKAVALALREFPAVNSTTDGKQVRWRSHVHLGLAVSLEEGLVVPVIRDAEDLPLAEMHERATELTAKARAGKLTPEEMAGSTFTISNMGMMEVENFTAIINPGESAILAVSSVLPQPVVRNDQIVIRQMMKMTLSSDHRLIDGALAARFVNAVRSKLEEINLWKRLA
jgi:pyruvate dehydrogenase E2 component (dihydrolipoamide acetyltransferase)